MTVFKTQTAARDFLESRGFKISIQGFNKHFKDGKVSRGQDGFEEGALLAYAAAYLTTTAREASQRAALANEGRLTADQELKQVQAARLKVKLARETGEVIPMARHKEELAMRAAFFRGELEQFARRVAPVALILVGGDESRLKELTATLEKELCAAMDLWSADRDFTVLLESAGA